MERALSLIFENKIYIDKLKGKGYKEIIAFIVGVFICWYWDIDAFSMIFLRETVTFPGIVITGAIIAGGSKASVKLFRDMLGFRSIAEENRLRDERVQ